MTTSEAPPFNAMQKSLLEVLSVADYTGSQGTMMVCLILAYSAIDALAWLAAESDDEHVGTRYRRWVDRYMLPAAPALKCTAEEVYAARCGLLHTMTAESKEHKRKPLRRLLYAFGSATAASLQEKVDERKLVVVHLSDLTGGVRLGCAQMFEEGGSDARLRARIESKQQKFFASFSRADFGITESADR